MLYVELYIEEIEKEIESIKQDIQELKKEMEKSYVLVKEYVLNICEATRNKEYLSQYDFESTLDLLLNYAYHVNIEEELELIKSTYFPLYPDSISQYMEFYEEQLSEENEE